MIDIPDFRAAHIDLSRFDGDMGAAFQAFVGELLIAEGMDAHAFPGGIDLVEELEGGRLKVYECKVTTEDDVLKAANQRWRTTAGNLTRNLTAPEGPPAGQSQYRPWYDTDRQIRHYVFWLSGTHYGVDQIGWCVPRRQVPSERLGLDPRLKREKGETAP